MSSQDLRHRNQVETYVSPAGIAEALCAENMARTAFDMTASTTSDGPQRFRMPAGGEVKIYVQDVPLTADAAIVVAVTERFERIGSDEFILLPVKGVEIIRHDSIPTEAGVYDFDGLDGVGLVEITLRVDADRISETQPMP